MPHICPGLNGETACDKASSLRRLCNAASCHEPIHFISSDVSVDLHIVKDVVP